MSISPYFYFSNNVLFDFQSSDFFVVDMVLTWEVLKIRTEPGNQKKNLAAVLFSELMGRSIL
jgi:hypothetical protein